MNEETLDNRLRRPLRETRRERHIRFWREDYHEANAQRTERIRRGNLDMRRRPWVDTRRQAHMRFWYGNEKTPQQQQEEEISFYSNFDGEYWEIDKKWQGEERIRILRIIWLKKVEQRQKEERRNNWIQTQIQQEEDIRWEQQQQHVGEKQRQRHWDEIADLQSYFPQQYDPQQHFETQQHDEMSDLCLEAGDGGVFQQQLDDMYAEMEQEQTLRMLQAHQINEHWTKEEERDYRRQEAEDYINQQIQRHQDKLWEGKQADARMVARIRKDDKMTARARHVKEINRKNWLTIKAFYVKEER
jgi:hypothetical protein